MRCVSSVWKNNLLPNHFLKNASLWGFNAFHISISQFQGQFQTYNPNDFPFFPSINCAVYSEADIFSSSYLMPEYRWKVTLLSEGMLIQNCQQLFWRNPWLLWSLHPTECPNFDTESHDCSYLYILWENRFPPCKRVFSFCFLCSQAIPNRIVGTFVHTIKRRRKLSCLSRQYVLFYVVILAVVVRRRRLRYSKVPGSQSVSPNQCMSYNSHSLLILLLKFMLLFSATPYCGPQCLPHRRVTVTQECCARCRVIPSNAPLLPKATSIATTGQSAETS